MTRFIRNLARDRSPLRAIEYGLNAALVAVIAIAGLTAF